MSFMDSLVLLLVHSFSGRMPLLDAVGIFFAVYAIYLLAGVVGGVFIVESVSRCNASWARPLLTAIAAVFVALAINGGIGSAYFRERPFVAFGFVPLTIEARTSKSFPSDHTASAFALATVMLVSKPRLGALMLACAILIGLSRIFVGVHYPGDILAGAGIGILSAIYVSFLFNRYVR